MPELPEVETIKNQLTEVIPLTVVKTSFSKFHKSIVKHKNFSAKGKTLLEIKRVGKVLDFIFENDLHIISRLGMSGSWRISSTRIKVKHTHVQFECKQPDGSVIYLGYVDPRRFGSVNFLKSPEAQAVFASLGADVSTPAFNSGYLRGILVKHPNRPIKPLLLEQKYFAGIGNYIASEILGHAGILPSRLCKDISREESTRICRATKKVIQGSIKTKGLTFHGGYVDATGNKGEALSTLVVFNQKRCQMCKKSEVLKTVMMGRGTYHCPKCQK